MSNSGNPNTSIINMTITGNVTVDTAIRYGLVAVCAWATGAITGWLNANGFHDPNLLMYVGTGVATVAGGLVLSIWGIIRTSRNEAVIRIREAIAVQAGINVAENPAVSTPAVVSVPEAQKIIAEHATPVAVK